MSKAALRVLAALFSAGLLLSQSLVELSKAEQERREKLKGKTVKVVTNADLLSIRKAPAVQMTSAEPETGAPAGAPGEQETSEAPEREIRTRPSEEKFLYARQVLPDTTLVENPEQALNYPDGRYAEISMLGILDLEFSVQNGPGPDISIHARLAGQKEVMPGGEEEEGMPVGGLGYDWWEGFWYGVLVPGENGDWEAIGQGTGKASPEKFDLGSISSAKKIRIAFRPHTNPGLAARLFRSTAGEFTFGIDAVEALH
jgi:hypothetical protein